MCLLIHYTIFKNRMQEKQKARQSLAKYLLQRNINQRKALYIIRNLLRYITKTKFCISSLRKLFDTHLKVWWYTVLTDWWDTRATSRPWWYAIAFAMDKKIDLQKQVYFLVGAGGFEGLCPSRSQARWPDYVRLRRVWFESTITYSYKTKKIASWLSSRLSKNRVSQIKRDTVF